MRAHRETFTRSASPGVLDTFIFVFILFSFANATVSVYYGHVVENAPAQTRVDGLLLPVGEKCRVSLRESGHDVTLEGEGASDFRFVYKPEQGQLFLKTTKTLDREEMSTYTLSALRSYCFNNTVEMKITVLDLNDNIPRFISKKKIIEVKELTPIGSELARFYAVDRDSGHNSEITYYAFPQNENIFVIPKTGQVMLVKSLKGINNITIHIVAKDNGDAALESEPATLRVDVGASLFKVRKPRAVSEELFYTVTVSEDVKVGDMIFTVPDMKFEKRWFEIISEADSPVQIERDSGRLYMAESFKSPADVMIKVHNLKASS